MATLASPSILVEQRRDELGQYIFVEAIKTGEPPASRKPKWLYRSYPSPELSD